MNWRYKVLAITVLTSILSWCHGYLMGKRNADHWYAQHPFYQWSEPASVENCLQAKAGGIIEETPCGVNQPGFVDKRPPAAQITTPMGTIANCWDTMDQVAIREYYKQHPHAFAADIGNPYAGALVWEGHPDGYCKERE